MTPATRNSPGPRSANFSTPPLPQPHAATGTSHDQLDKDHRHNAAVSATLEFRHPHSPDSTFTITHRGEVRNVVGAQTPSWSVRSQARTRPWRFLHEPPHVAHR